MTRPALLLFLVVGCEHFVPETGAPLVERCVNGDSDPEADVSFQVDILDGIFRNQDTCVPCHAPGGDDDIGLETSGLDLSDHAGLIAGGANSGQTIVVAGQPCESILVQKLSAGPPFGSRMPFDGPPFLEPEEVRLIRDWIAEGARDN